MVGRQDRALDGQDAGRAGRDLRPRAAGTTSAATWPSPADHAAGGSLRRPAGDGGTQPQGRRLQEHLLHRRVGWEPHWYADGGDEVERDGPTAARKRIWIDDYYTKAHAQQNTWAAKFLGVGDTEVGNHANILDTSELLFVKPQHIRKNRLTGNDYQNNGVSGNNQGKATAEVGKQLLQIKLDLAMAQIKRMQSGAEPPVAAPAAPAGGGGAGRGGRGGPGGGGGGNPEGGGGAAVARWCRR
jgi:hypothetical protein